MQKYAINIIHTKYMKYTLKKITFNKLFYISINAMSLFNCIKVNNYMKF